MAEMFLEMSKHPEGSWAECFSTAADTRGWEAGVIWCPSDLAQALSRGEVSNLKNPTRRLDSVSTFLGASP